MEVVSGSFALTFSPFAFSCLCVSSWLGGCAMKGSLFWFWCHAAPQTDRGWCFVCSSTMCSRLGRGFSARTGSRGGVFTVPFSSKLRLERREVSEHNTTTDEMGLFMETEGPQMGETFPLKHSQAAQFYKHCLLVSLVGVLCGD